MRLLVIQTRFDFSKKPRIQIVNGVVLNQVLVRVIHSMGDVCRRA